MDTFVCRKGAYFEPTGALPRVWLESKRERTVHIGECNAHSLFLFFEGFTLLFGIMNRNRGDSMHQALYRLYRPKTFDEILGQDAVVSVLKEQVRTGAIGHAYLFSGMRGTGKTSCAKVFARALNCLDPQEGNPCNHCEHCEKILEEATIDIIEMDAASNRRIDDIRDLRERVIYLPQDLNYKVYIIDEAHMITNEGFNALLKTLEEPPSHLVFILATTEPEKIPKTILSRVQRFHFVRLSDEIIQSHVADILRREEKTFDEDVPAKIALRSGGAMRDALTNLDQLMHLTHIRTEDVDEITGSSRMEAVKTILEAIAKKDAVTVGSVLETLHGNPEVLLADLTLGARKILREKMGAVPVTIPWIEEISEDSALHMLRLFLDTKTKLRYSDDGHLLVELAVYEAIYETDKRALEERVARLEEMLKDCVVPKSEMTGHREMPMKAQQGRPKTQAEPAKPVEPKAPVPTEKSTEPKSKAESRPTVQAKTTAAQYDEDAWTVDPSEMGEMDWDSPWEPEEVTAPTPEKMPAEKPVSREIPPEVSKTEPVEAEIPPEENPTPIEKSETDVPKSEPETDEVQEETGADDVEIDFDVLVKRIGAQDPAMGTLLSFGTFAGWENGIMKVTFPKKHAFQRDYLAHPDRLDRLTELSQIDGKAVRFLLTLEEKGDQSEEIRAFFGDLLERGEFNEEK